MGKKNYNLFQVEISKNFPRGISTEVDWKPVTNIIETEQKVIIEMELPGVRREEISLSLHNDREFIIKGSKKQKCLDGERVTYYLFEREFGTFFRKVIIDFPLDADQVSSSLENGVLYVEVKKKQSENIDIKVEERD